MSTQQLGIPRATVVFQYIDAQGMIAPLDWPEATDVGWISTCQHVKTENTIRKCIPVNSGIRF